MIDVAASAVNRMPDDHLVVRNADMEFSFIREDF